jgi:hypothetical protein
MPTRWVRALTAVWLACLVVGLTLLANFGYGMWQGFADEDQTGCMVVSAEIVDPDNRTALIVDASGYNLALTTCRPLWAGAFARLRYVIHARQLSPVPTHSGNVS